MSSQDTPNPTQRAYILQQFVVESNIQAFDFSSPEEFERKTQSAATVATIAQGTRPRVAFSKPSNAIIAIEGSPNVVDTSARVRIGADGTVEFLERGQVTEEIPFERIAKMNKDNLFKLMQRIRVAMIHPKFIVREEMK